MNRIKTLMWSDLLTGEEDRASGQAQFEVCGRGLPQLTDARCEVQHVVHQLDEKE